MVVMFFVSDPTYIHTSNLDMQDIIARKYLLKILVGEKYLRDKLYLPSPALILMWSKMKQSLMEVTEFFYKKPFLGGPSFSDVFRNV